MIQKMCEILAATSETFLEDHPSENTEFAAAYPYGSRQGILSLCGFAKTWSIQRFSKIKREDAHMNSKLRKNN